MNEVLVLDDAGGTAEQIRRALPDWDWSVTPVADVEEAARALRHHPSLLVLNPCIQPAMAFGPLESLARDADEVPLVVLSGCAPVEAAARILFPGASAILRMPLAPAVLRDKLLASVRSGRAASGADADLPAPNMVVGGTPAMQEVLGRIRRAARSDATVLITGETGVGKGLVAKAIHELSPRRGGPFLVVSCAELAEGLIESELFGHARGSFTGASHSKVGLFEAAEGGTVLLDEVADASPAVQARLLRVVEERQTRRVGEVRSRDVDIRVIAAAQGSLKERVEAAQFREDLYYRLRVLPISLPPLRERREDIPALASLFLSELVGPDKGPRHCSPLAMEILQSYPWPGNIRELHSVIEAALTTRSEGTITAADLPAEVTAFWSDHRRDKDEAARILKALAESQGRRGPAAEILGISRTTLWRRMTHLMIPSRDVED